MNIPGLIFTLIVVYFIVFKIVKYVIKGYEDDMRYYAADSKDPYTYTDKNQAGRSWKFLYNKREKYINFLSQFTIISIVIGFFLLLLALN